jgi:phage terminase large subunit-like protein
MNWMMSNVTVKPDKNDNIFPNKSTPEAKSMALQRCLPG